VCLQYNIYLSVKRKIYQICCRGDYIKDDYTNDDNDNGDNDNDNAYNDERVGVIKLMVWGI
jgi:hypothetical protein